MADFFFSSFVVTVGVAFEASCAVSYLGVTVNVPLPQAALGAWPSLGADVSAACG